jgi:hypothetical protein
MASGISLCIWGDTHPNISTNKTDKKTDLVVMNIAPLIFSEPET